MRTSFLLAALAACGSSSSTTTAQQPSNKPEVAAGPRNDDCAGVVARSRKVIDDILVKYTGKPASDEDIKLMIEACLDPDSKPTSDEIVACVNAADDDAAIRSCWLAGMPAGDEPEPRPSQAAIYLNKLAKNAKVVWLTTAQFAIGRAGPTPAALCGCAKKCPVDRNAWTSDPVWTALDFEVTDETFFVFTYESDGKTFTATASGDLDCDGNPGVWTLTGTGGATPDASPTITLTAPKGVY